MREGLHARLAEIACRSIPALATAGMMGESLDVLAEPVGIEMLDGVHDPGVQRAPRLLATASCRPRWQVSPCLKTYSGSGNRLMS